MPIQRIPRYRMLLESLVSCTPVAFNTGSPHANPVLTAALELATNLATDLNEKKVSARRSENFFGLFVSFSASLRVVRGFCTGRVVSVTDSSRLWCNPTDCCCESLKWFVTL